MRLSKTVSAALLVGAVFAVLAGCQQQEGPAERAGKATDRALENVGQQIEKAGDSLQDAAKGNK